MAAADIRRVSDAGFCLLMKYLGSVLGCKVRDYVSFADDLFPWSPPLLKISIGHAVSKSESARSNAFNKTSLINPKNFGIFDMYFHFLIRKHNKLWWQLKDIRCQKNPISLFIVEWFDDIDVNQETKRPIYYLIV